MNAAREKKYTYADLLCWDGKTRYELYCGRPVALASPSDVHQEICGELFAQFHANIKEKSCRTYFAPFDVRLFENGGDAPEHVDTVVQPDLMVVCDRSKIDSRGIHGAPDLVVEVISPSTARNDKLLKFNLYRIAGVKEYWIVDPSDRTVQTFVLKDGQYVAEVFAESDTVTPHIFPDCRIELKSVFGSSY